MSSQRESDVVRQFVAGTMPLSGFVQRLHRDLPLRQYLASGGGLAVYAQADLLGQLLRTGWQDVVAVRQAQAVLERFLRAQGVDVEPTDLYQRRADFQEKLGPLLAELQPPWLKIPVPYLARLLTECGHQADSDLDDLVRAQVEGRFRFVTHPPQWLHEEYWPVGQHGPLVFVEQVDVAPDRPGRAVNYVFVDPRNGAFLVLPQTLPDPDAVGAPPAPAGVQTLRGVVPVLVRPGAFWIVPPVGRPGQAPDDPVDGPGHDDEPDVAASDQPTAGLPQTEPIPTAALEPTSPADLPAPADQPAGSPAAQPAPVAPTDPAPAEPTAAPGLAATEPVTTDPLEPPAPVADASFRPWTLVLADGRSFSLRSRSVLVGRRPSTDEPGVQVVVVEDSTRSLSKSHARLDLVDDTWQVTDLASTNGVVVTTTDGQETKAEPGQPAPVYGYVAFGSVEARLRPDQTA